MAEENIENMRDVEDDFRTRLAQEDMQIGLFMSSPQMTCGQHEFNDIITAYEIDRAAAGSARVQDMEMFPFFQQIKKRFAKEFKEFEEMQDRMSGAGIPEMRQAYLNENNFPENHPARAFEAYYKTSPEG